MKLDLNCDLGEGEPPSRTRALMRWITSANVACGGHAGDPTTMETCVRLAKQHGIRLGAHPGPWSRNDFGRGRIQITPAELELLLLHQVSALDRVSRANGMRLHHIKLHGALYHASEEDENLVKVYVGTVQRFWPGTKIYVRAGGRVVQIARHLGVPVWEEAFADRAYRDDGSLVPRNEPGAVLTSIRDLRERVRQIIARNEVATVSGQHIPLRPQTICIHSDTPNAVEFARAAAQILESCHD